MVLKDIVARIETSLSTGALEVALQQLREALSSEGREAPEIRDPNTISLNAGLAWLCNRLVSDFPGVGYEQKMIAYGQSALLIDPRDSLAFQVLPDEQIHLVAHNLLRHRKSRGARLILERLSKAPEPAAAREMLDLVNYVDAQKARITALPPPAPGAKQPLLINAIVWGEAYTEPLFTYGFPSLLASGNLPNVAKDREIIIDFYTSASDVARIDEHPVTESVKRFAKFRYNVIPDPLLAAQAHDATRWCAGAAQQCSAFRAQQLGADLMFLCGSAVYSAQCLSRAYGFLEQGYEAVACLMPRTLETMTYGALNGHAAIEDGTIEIDAEALTNFIVENLHPHSLACFISAEEKYLSQNPVTLFFRTKSGFSCRTYQPSPLVIANSLLLHGFDLDYYTIDVRFLAELVGARAPDRVIKIVGGSDEEVAVTDVECTDGVPMQHYGDIALSLENCASGPLHTSTRAADLDYFRWALEQRFVYHSVDGEVNLPSDGISETEAMEEVAALLKAYGASVKNRLYVYERLAH